MSLTGVTKAKPANPLSVLRRDAWRDLPPGVYAQMVAHLYSPQFSVLGFSCFALTVVGATAAYIAHLPWLMVFVVLALGSIGGVALLVRWRRRAEASAPPQVWDRRFERLSWVSSTSVGLMVGIGLSASDDMRAHMVLIAMMLGAVSTTVRNYCRPRVVLGQLAGLILPGVVALILKFDPVYLVLALLGVGLAREMPRFCLSLHQRMVEALEAEESRGLQNQRFDAALSHMTHGLCMYDRDWRLVVCNQAYLDIFDLSPEVVKPGALLMDLYVHAIARGLYPGKTPEELMTATTAQLAQGAMVVTQTLGDGRIISVSRGPTADGGWVATFEDVTQRKAAEAKIEHLARHDVLTGLCNRANFREKLEVACEHARRGAPSAVMYLDLDRFKAVNDTLGHPVGDALLKQVTARLLACTRGTDTVARFGGDEFAIIQTGAPQPAGAEVLAQRLVQALSAPFEIDGRAVVIGASIGVAVAPIDGVTPDVLMKQADLALYEAKGQGRGRHRFFSPGMDDEMQARRALELDLRRAAELGEFELAYQPMFSIETKAITGFEALLRWRHPTRGLVPPNDFIPVADEIGLMPRIGEWVLHRACADAVTWPKQVRLAVNLAAAQFAGDLPATVLDALTRSGLSPNRLELEVTENLMLRDPEPILATLQRLRGLGVRIAIDNFGTGYSSLAYVRRFAFDKIKIGQPFVQDLPEREQSLAVVRAVTNLGGSLGIATTGEGVETEAQLERLRAEGCIEAQGFFLGRPGSAADALVLAKGDKATVEAAARSARRRRG